MSSDAVSGDSGESRPEEAKLRREVDPLELFFDLVFVFAVSQLSNHLQEHLSWTGAAQTAVMLVAVFGTWPCSTPSCSRSPSSSPGSTGT